MPTVLFDIDGTLVRCGGAGKAAIEAALTAEFDIAEVRHRVGFSGRTDRAISRDLLAAHGVAPTADREDRLMRRYLTILPRTLPEYPGVVLPGVADLLDRLQAAGVRLGLLTGNQRAGAQIKLTHFGLWGHFGFGGFGDAHVDRDDVARDALAAAGGAPGDIWVVGDTPLDVRCARAVGAKVVAVATGWHDRESLAPGEPDAILNDLTDPLPFLPD